MIFVEIINPSIFTELEKGHIYEARENKNFWYIDIMLPNGKIIKDISIFRVRRLGTKESRKYTIEKLMNKL